jgi:hypothetical protein
MLQHEQLLVIQKRKLQKALQHLQYSYKKIQSLSTNAEQLNDEELEVWESFAARFSRVTDIFMTQYLRTLVLTNDPGFSGTLRDFINQGEKLKIIDDSNAWMKIRELRNITAHEYSEKDLSTFFANLKKECPRLLKIVDLLDKTN